MICVTLLVIFGWKPLALKNWGPFAYPFSPRSRLLALRDRFFFSIFLAILSVALDGPVFFLHLFAFEILAVLYMYVYLVLAGGVLEGLSCPFLFEMSCLVYIQHQKGGLCRSVIGLMDR